jgi:hypothetical protein
VFSYDFIGTVETSKKAPPSICIDQSVREGLKGAADSTKADEVSTTANEVSEARSESPESSQPGLSCCLIGLV